MTSNQYGYIIKTTEMDTERRIDVPNWLKEERNRKGVSQKSIAETIGIARVSYARIENGERNPSVETAKKIADVLGFEWTRFYEDEETQHKAG